MTTTSKCPACGKHPGEAKYSEPHGLFLLFCCRYQAGAPTAEETEKVWDGLVKYNEDRKSSPAR